MANVIREDVIKIGFDTDFSELTQLSKEFDELKKLASGGVGGDAFDELKENAKEATKSSDGLKNKLKDVAGVSVTKLTSGLKNVGDKLTDIAKRTAVAAFKGLKKVAGISFKALVGGITGASVAVGTLVASAVSAYADREQFVGGVETLFKDSAGIVKKNANNAFKTAGLSANKYMETVTSFSASMIQSVGGDTKKAAELSDMAMTDMADNSAKMGTSMDSIMQTYQSLARGNFAMLDNLKLGFGGTKEEMKRLIKEASQLDSTVKEGDLSFANIAKAIHAVQNNLGITGTTAKEASQTISGSFSAMKAAWSNLLPALLEGGDSFNQCVDNLVSSAKTFGKNIMPAIKKALSGVGSLISELAPLIAKELPSLVAELAPPLAKAGVDIVIELGNAMVDNAPLLWDTAWEIVQTVVKAIYKGFTGKEMSGDMFATLKSKVEQAFNAIKNIIVGVLKFGSKLMTALAPVLLFIGNIALNVFSWIGDNINWLLPLVTSLVAAFVAYKVAMVTINAVQKIMAVTSTLLGTALPAVAGGTTAAGAASAASATQIGMAAKSFMQMGVGVLAVGVGILAVALGFALLAQSAIALANAGWGAIAVMVGMVAVIALLAVGASALGAALTAGAVGFLAFGGAVMLVGAGFALIGAGALLAANALRIVAGILPQIVVYGLLSSVSLVALGVGLTAFAVGAILASAAAVVLGAGLLVLTPTVLLFTASMAALMATFVVLAPLAALFVTSMMLLAPAFALLGESAPKFKKAISGMAGKMTKLVVPTGLLAAALIPLSAEFVVLSTSAVALTVALVAMVTSTTMLSTLFAMISVTSAILAVAFGVLCEASARLVASTTPLAGALLAMALPLGAVSAKFVVFAAAVVAVASASSRSAATFTLLSVVIAVVSASTETLSKNFTKVGAAVPVMVSAIEKGFVAMTSAVIKGGHNMLSSLKSMLRQMVVAVNQTNLTNAGQQMINGLIRGINSRRSAAISAARSIAQAINKEYRKIQDINSPSGEWESYGAYQIQGGINGMEKMMPKLQSTVADVGQVSMPYASSYTPENSSVSYSNSRKTEYNTYAPQFSLTIEGSTNERTLERKVKRWVQEGIAEAVDGVSRSNPTLREV